jgi:ATP-binding cassette subfamily C protein LapB
MMLIPVAELQALLGKQQVRYTPARLLEAYRRVAHTQADLPLLDQLRQMLSETGLKDVQPVLLPWRRFDLRRLPALVWHDAIWWLAERLPEGQIRLSHSAGEVHECDEHTLADAKLLWLRVAPTAGGAAAPSTASMLAGPDNPAMQLVWRELLRDRSWIVKVVVATVMVNFLAIPTSIFAMQVYDRVVPTMAYATLTTLVAGMALVLGLDWILKTLRAHIIDSVASSVDKRLSQQVYEHLLQTQLDQQPRSLGTLAAQVGGLDSVRQFFSSGIVFGLVDMPFALLFIAIIALIGGQVAWVYAGLLPVAILLGVMTRLRLRQLTREQMARSNERQGMLVDSIRGAETIRASNAAWRFAQNWQAISQSLAGYSIRQKAISQFSTATTGTLSTVAYVAAVVVGVWQLELGHLTMGGMIACSILGGKVIGPIAQGVQYLVQWQQVSESISMVNQVLRLPRERREAQTLLLPDQAPTHIQLDAVRFAYPQSPVQQLRIDTLQFKAGERVLLLGAVGCGKSTLLKVLAGIYRPSEGRIRLGDADLWEIDPQVVCAQVGYLPQSVHLFKGTLRSNLTLSGAVSDSTWLAVSRELGLDAVAAASPQGMDLEISEGGEGLSGGQRQLVGLGRVLMAQPRIWLLDEPTASLDGEAETRVWQAVQARTRPEDILIVSTHRPLQAAQLVNRVIVMQQGEVIKDGRPEQVIPGLMARAPAPVAQLVRQRPGAMDVI